MVPKSIFSHKRFELDCQEKVLIDNFFSRQILNRNKLYIRTKVLHDPILDVLIYNLIYITIYFLKIQDDIYVRNTKH